MMNARVTHSGLSPMQEMVPWWKWFYYINPISWTLYAIIVTQLGDDSHVVSPHLFHERINVVKGALGNNLLQHQELHRCCLSPHSKDPGGCNSVREQISYSPSHENLARCVLVWVLWFHHPMGPKTLKPVEAGKSSFRVGTQS